MFRPENQMAAWPFHSHSCTCDCPEPSIRAHSFIPHWIHESLYAHSNIGIVYVGTNVYFCGRICVIGLWHNLLFCYWNSFCNNSHSFSNRIGLSSFQISLSNPWQKPSLTLCTFTSIDIIGHPEQALLPPLCSAKPSKQSGTSPLIHTQKNDQPLFNPVFLCIFANLNWSG